MNNERTGNFIAIASVFGRSLDSKGNIIDRDPHGLPSIWLTPIAGTIPNRNTLAGSVALRAGIPVDSNGVIAPGDSTGKPFSKRIVYGSYNLQSMHDDYGAQYTWTVIKDMSLSSPKEIEETKEMLGESNVFAVDRPPLPENYQRRTDQHIGRNRMDERNHPVQGSRTNNTNPVAEAKRDVGSIPSDTTKNPEVELTGAIDEQGNSRINPVKP